MQFVEYVTILNDMWTSKEKTNIGDLEILRRLERIEVVTRNKKGGRTLLEILKIKIGNRIRHTIKGKGILTTVFEATVSGRRRLKGRLKITDDVKN